MADALRKIRVVMRTSPLLVALTVFFMTVLAVLVTLLWLQVKRAADVITPMGTDATVMHAGTEGGKEQELLILNSFHLGYSWSDHEMDGMIETFRMSGWKINLVVEYLDCKRFPAMKHFDRLRGLYQEKYRGRHFPVVIAADNPAFDFALRYRAQLFPQSAIVFCGINGFSRKMLRGQHNITGIAERLNVMGTLSLAMKIHPRKRQVFIVHDYTITGLLARRETEEQLKPFDGLLDFHYLENKTTTELKAYLKDIPADSLVLILPYSMDKGGQIKNYEDMAHLVSASTHAPVYGLYEESLGYGIIGGELLGGKRHGAHAAETALRVLSGVPASEIPVDLNCPAQIMFDYNQLQRFYIPLSWLPKDAQVVNLPVPFISRYRGLVLTTLCLIVVLVAGIVILGFNVYHRKVAEDEQKKLQAQLMQAQKMEAVGLLAGGIAHDFNNIITAIVGYTTLVKKKLQPGDFNIPFLEHILSAADRASKLTRSLLAFSRKQEIEARPVDLNSIVRNTERIVLPLIGADIAFTTELARGRMTVMADSGQVEQVLMNLCTNARDAMSGGGRLTIRTGEQTVAESFRKTSLLEKAGRYGVISVSDTGAGMDESTRKQIFEPFFTTKDVGKGTGLGLSIAYGIIKQHKGMITVTSEPGKGTTFNIFLPLIASTAEAPRQKAAGQVQGGRETVLLAEDEPSVRSSISIMLTEAGYQVVEAIDGTDAVARFMELKDTVHLLLTDVIMPGKNGSQVYEQIRLVNPLVKVLFMSGYTADMIQNRGIEALSFIPKPVHHDDLLRKVREVLDS